MTVPADGGSAREVYQLPKESAIALFRGTTWTNDGRRVLAVGTQSGRSVLWSFDVDGNQDPVASPIPPGPGVPVTSLALHPDGKRIAFTAGQRKQEVWVIRGLVR